MVYRYIESHQTQLPMTKDIPEQTSLDNFWGCLGYSFGKQRIEFDLYNASEEDEKEFQKDNCITLRYSSPAGRCGKLFPIVYLNLKTGTITFTKRLGKSAPPLKADYINHYVPKN